MPETYAYVGHRELTDTANDQAAHAFLVNSLINRLATTALVRVTAVAAGGLSDPVGFLDMQPLVHQINGQGTVTEHGVIPNVPYFRLQGGANAVIIDPVAGDIGIALFCSRDSTAAKSARGPAPPGSRRRYDMSDGLYIGGVRNGPPTQYIWFAADGIHIVSPTALIVQAPNATLDAAGNLLVKGEVVRGGLGGGPLVHLGTHDHPQGADSHGDAEVPTGPPTPGS